jgi:hypothetical protein
VLTKIQDKIQGTRAAAAEQGVAEEKYSQRQKQYKRQHRHTPIAPGIGEIRNISCFVERYVVDKARIGADHRRWKDILIQHGSTRHAHAKQTGGTILERRSIGVEKIKPSDIGDPPGQTHSPRSDDWGTNVW